ncbi:MAG TPA: phosphatidylserine/phosphatidylglycerophosphate/cardiolipin synthase family protein [Gemmataceae bacterium]|jgi:cardiolipin synthase
MTTHRTDRAGRRGLGRYCWWLAGLALLTGSQTSPGQVGGCTPKDADSSRYRVLTRQLLCDTAGEITHHPLRAGATVLHDKAGWFGSVGRGLIGKRIAMHLHRTPSTMPGCPVDLDPALVETDLQPASVRLYRDGGEALAVLEKMIDSAACRIDVLMYLWEDDAVGWSLARHLAAGAGPDRRVRILIDGGANLIFVPSPTDESPAGQRYPVSTQQRSVTAGQANRVVCWLAQQPYIELVRIRNPFGHFDHRKLVLIDGQAAWAGGRNFSYPSFFVRHDVSFTMEGPLVSEWQVGFERYWRGQGGSPACIEENTPPFAANAAGRLVENTPTQHGLRHALYHAIDHARSFVWLENPYLCDNGVITKLARARRRGVDARVVLTIQSDSDSINRTNRVTANRLLAAGVRVYLYPGRIHTKAAEVDGCWAYLGSGNFDLLSLRRNHELGVVFGPGPIVAELDGILFQPDFNPAWELREPLPLTIHDYTAEMLAAFFL